MTTEEEKALEIKIDELTKAFQEFQTAILLKLQVANNGVKICEEMVVKVTNIQEEINDIKLMRAEKELNDLKRCTKEKDNMFDNMRKIEKNSKDNSDKSEEKIKTMFEDFITKKFNPLDIEFRAWKNKIIGGAFVIGILSSVLTLAVKYFLG